jgi:hypothetical protein
MIWLALVLACDDGNGSGSGDDGAGDDGNGDVGSGDDGGGDAGGGDDGGSGDDAKVSNVSSECTDSGMTATGGLIATAESDGVHVIDDNYPFSCCATFDVAIAVALDKHWATASYTNVGDKCDCMCRYEVRYTIGGLDKGTWTIESPTGETVDVTI